MEHIEEPLMTIAELVEAFERNLIPTCVETEGKFIMEGKYPFAIGTKGKKNNIYRIYRKGFYEWLQERIQNPVKRDEEK